MSVSRLLIFILICGVFIRELPAQDSSKIHYGMGINFEKDLVFANVGGDFSVLSLPYDFSNFSIIIRTPKFRFEPSIGYFHYASSYSRTDYERESSQSNWRVGLKFCANKVSGQMHHYYGVSLGLIFTSLYSKTRSEFDSDSDDESKTDFFVGPVLGGEYNFNEYFSLGGEVHFNYISMGDYDGDSEGDRSESALTTRAIIVLRWYFK